MTEPRSPLNLSAVISTVFLCLAAIVFAGGFAALGWIHSQASDAIAQFNVRVRPGLERQCLAHEAGHYARLLGRGADRTWIVQCDRARITIPNGTAP